MTPCERGSLATVELYFYDELSHGERAVFERHLSGCADCQAALEDLTAIRSALALRAVEAPTGGDWAPFMARLEERLRVEPPRRLAWRGPVLGALAAAAVLVMAALVPALLTRPRTPMGVPVATANPSDQQNALAAAAGQHFGRSKVVLLGLLSKDADGAGHDWAYEQGLASSLLPETSLYRMAAEEQGLTRLVEVLSDLELVLLQASAGDGRDRETLERVQRLIRRRDLMVKMDLIVAQPAEAAGRAT